MKRFLVFASVVYACCLSAAPLWAWGSKGHDIIAYIAECHLNRRAQKTIEKIFDGHSMVYYASWMDNLRSSPQWETHYRVTETWHYANVDAGESYETMRKCPTGDIVSATNMVIEGLRSGILDDSTRCEYLKMLIHMVGDMHCPMHAGHLSDRGGNGFQVRWFGRPTNLHAVWDSKVLESAHSWSYSEWQKQLDRTTRKEFKRMSCGEPYEWFLETVGIAQKLYEDIEPGQNLAYDYLYCHTGMLEQQLLLAGYRLAGLLNELFG